jgi:hypothetical protein
MADQKTKPHDGDVNGFVDCLHISFGCHLETLLTGFAMLSASAPCANAIALGLRFGRAAEHRFLQNVWDRSLKQIDLIGVGGTGVPPVEKKITAVYRATPNGRNKRAHL